jgi:putative glycosyltransferase (TIGR04372 family)
MLFVPAVLLLRIVKSLYRVRYGYFIVDRIGHFVFDVGHYLSEYAVSSNQRGRDIFFFEGAVANKYFSELCRREICVTPVARYLYKANNLLPLGSDQQILPAREHSASRDRDGLLSITGPAFSFTEQEEALGNKYLEDMACLGKKHVCLIVRDSAYLEQATPNRDWSYHDYRDTNIEDYEEAAVALVNRGYVVLRMGKSVRQPFSVEHSGVIDYATSSRRTDFLDVWLMARCAFCVSTGTGLDEVAAVFRRPVVYVNYLPTIDVVSYVPSISVFKSLNWSPSGKPLSLKDHLNHAFFSSQQYQFYNISIRNLTSVDIRDAVVEMEERLAGTWVTTAPEVKLQDRFWEILKTSPAYGKYHGKIHPEARIGARFLEKNHEWFLQ